MPSIAIVGSKQLCLDVLRELVDEGDVNVTLVVTIDDSADTRSKRDDLVGFCQDHGIPAVVSRTASHAHEALRATKVDLGLVLGWYRIIPDDVLVIARQGFFGIHFSSLPSYRGSAPVVWAMLNGESTIGYSIFEIASGMDEGRIAGHGEIGVGENDYIADVLDGLSRLSVTHLARLAGSLAAGTAPLSQQASGPISYGGVRRPADGRIDWTLAADMVGRFVRAQSRPYPGAFSNLGDDQVVIWRGHPVSTENYFGAPGQVVRATARGPIVACGGGTGFLVEEATYAGDHADRRIEYRLGSTRFH